MLPGGVHCGFLHTAIDEKLNRNSTVQGSDTTMMNRNTYACFIKNYFFCP
jgi:hypothetical protein